jgi:DNA-binding NarL/FixJ family response regulator
MSTPVPISYFVGCPTILTFPQNWLWTQEMPPLILIADDSALLRTALRGLFNGLGDYEIIEAKTGVEAVDKAEQSRPDLIILDFAMPAMDGLSATRLLQKRLPEIPILMFTMHYTEQLWVAAKSAGARKLISKSEAGNLVATVQELLALTPDMAKPASARPPRKENAAFAMPATRTGS